MDTNEFSEFSNMDPDSSLEGSNPDKSHFRIRECIFKVFPKVLEQFKVIWIEIQTKGLQTLTLEIWTGTPHSVNFQRSKAKSKGQIQVQEQIKTIGVQIQVENS